MILAGLASCGLVGMEEALACRWCKRGEARKQSLLHTTLGRIYMPAQRTAAHQQLTRRGPRKC